MGITTTIPTNLEFPHRGELERDDFVLAQEIAQDLLAGSYTTALNEYATELNSTKTDINIKWNDVKNQAVDGGYSQDYINSNFYNKTQTYDKTETDNFTVKLTGTQTIAGTKTFSTNPSCSVAQSTSANALTKYSAVVKNTGDETIAGVKTFSSQPASSATQGTSTNDLVKYGTINVANSAPIKTALNASGTAPIYACRAWVNFNGTGTVAIRASGNVSSITDNGVGTYTVNFSTAMADANYSISGIAKRTTSGTTRAQVYVANDTGISTSDAKIAVTAGDGATLADALECYIIVHR